MHGAGCGQRQRKGHCCRDFQEVCVAPHGLWTIDNTAKCFMMRLFPRYKSEEGCAHIFPFIQICLSVSVNIFGGNTSRLPLILTQKKTWKKNLLKKIRSDNEILAPLWRFLNIKEKSFYKNKILYNLRYSLYKEVFRSTIPKNNESSFFFF